MDRRSSPPINLHGPGISDPFRAAAMAREQLQHRSRPAPLPACADGDNASLSSNSLCILVHFLAEQQNATSSSNILKVPKTGN